MDKRTFSQLASVGLSAGPGKVLTDLWVWCRDYCEASGDARYCLIGDTLRS